MATVTRTFEHFKHGHFSPKQLCCTKYQCNSVAQFSMQILCALQSKIEVLPIEYTSYTAHWNKKITPTKSCARLDGTKKWAFLPNSLRRYWLSAVGFLSPDHFTPVAMATPFTASSPSFFFPFPFPFPIAAFPDISAQRSLLIQPLPLFAVCDHMTINCNYDVILVSFPGWRHWPYDLGNETLQIVLNMASLEDQALERKARLKALRAKKEGKQDSQVREYERI